MEVNFIIIHQLLGVWYQSTGRNSINSSQNYEKNLKV